MGPLELRRTIPGAAREVAALNKHVGAKRPEFADLGPDLDARGTANAACLFSPGMTVSPETAAALTNVASAEERVCRAYLSKKEREKIRRDVEVGQSRANEVLHVCGLRKRPVYWEIFGGSMLMSRIAAKRGWEVIQPVDYGTGLFVGRGGRDRRRRIGVGVVGVRWRVEAATARKRPSGRRCENDDPISSPWRQIVDHIRLWPYCDKGLVLILGPDVGAVRS